MANLAFFPMYPKDFLGDTDRLSARRFGGYMRLILNSWVEPLENDLEELSEISRLSEAETKVILERYFTLENGLWINNRLEEERGKAIARHERATKASEARWNPQDNAQDNAQGDARSNAQDDAQGNAPDMPTHNSQLTTHRKNNSQPKTNNENDEQALAVIGFLSDYPSLSFPDMTIPRMLEISFSVYGEKAVRYLLDQIAKVKDLKKRYSPSYVKAIIDNAPLMKIKSGEVDSHGFEIKARTRQEAMDWSDKNAVRMDKIFSTRKNKDGEIERFEDGTAKFFMKADLVSLEGAQA